MPLFDDLPQAYLSNNTDAPQLLSSLENRKPCIWLSALTDIEDAAVWKSGALQDGIIDDEAADWDTSGYTAALSDYYRILFTERNAVMADAAKSYLDDGKKVFFLVGAEHLLGGNGVIAYLEAGGYHIAQLGGTERPLK